MSQPLIDLQHISKSFDGELILDDLNLSIRENSFVTLLGPSGCGKTTTLRILGGFTSPDTGRVLFDGQDITKLPPNKRQLNTVFQKYALFPHMTVMENIVCGGRQRAEEYIKKFYLSGKENIYPAHLSGGEKQRTAIARMLAASPDLIMFDEPLSAVDSYLKSELEAEILTAAEEFGGQALIVSHDMGEIYRLSERVAVIENGKISAIQTKNELFEAPASAAAARLMGYENISNIKLNSNGNYVAEDWGITVKALRRGPYKYAAVRGEDIIVSSSLPSCEGGFVKVRTKAVIKDIDGFIIKFISPRGHMMTARLKEELPSSTEEVYRQTLRAKGDRTCLHACRLEPHTYFKK